MSDAGGRQPAGSPALRASDRALQPAHGPRVLHVIDNLEIGGAQRLLFVLAKGMPKADLRVLSLGRERDFLGARLRAEGAEVTVVSGCQLWNPASYSRISGQLAQTGPDILHVHLTYATIFGAICGWRAGCRVVASIHNTRTVDYPGLRGWVLRLIETAAVRLFVDKVIHVGEGVAQANARRFGRTPAVTIDNVIAPIPPGDPARRAGLRQQLGAAADDVVILSTARLSVEKDIPNLLAAFAALRASQPRARLWICGDGPLRGELEARAGNIGLGDAALFLGGRDDVPDLLRASDIFVLSSAWEGLPLGLLEALSAGLPVAATAVGGVPDYVTEDVGRLVPAGAPEALAAALGALVDDPVLRERLGAQARSSARAFTDVAGWAGRLEEIYRSLGR